MVTAPSSNLFVVTALLASLPVVTAPVEILLEDIFKLSILTLPVTVKFLISVRLDEIFT